MSKNRPTALFLTSNSELPDAIITCTLHLSTEPHLNINNYILLRAWHRAHKYFIEFMLNISLSLYLYKPEVTAV
jgi:hypothetical protein